MPSICSSNEASLNATSVTFTDACLGRILLKGIDDVSQSIKELFIKTVREVTAKRLVFVAMATDLSMKVMKPSEFDTLLKELRKKNEKDNH